MDRDEQIAELYGHWKRALRKGRALTPEEVCRDCPELLEAFRETLPQLAAVDALFNDQTGDDVSPEVLLTRLDAAGYRPLGFHKQGGLGVVMVGEDIELRRAVALKCLRPRAAAAEGALDRFVQEAEVTAKLEHPGIVPVYRMGRDAVGRPYYAMRFVRGATLGEEIDRFHSGGHAWAESPQRNVAFRRLMRAFVAICETMSYTHARGVIHRDLKPDNVMLGPYGETIVLDWGLAKRIDTSNPEQTVDLGMEPIHLGSGKPSTSIVGRAKGSPAFMSPEQARGDWDLVGPLSDVYSLGSTLYALLTGTAPYGAKEVPDAQKVIATVEKVKTGIFVPPRQVNPAVPRALDQVCRKAMAFQLADRYAGARELAADVERWLADEPVSAWREPFAVRARRWLKRHRTFVAMSVVTLAVAAGLLGLFSVQMSEKNRQLADQVIREQQAQQRERAARLESERLQQRNLLQLGRMMWLTVQSRHLALTPPEPVNVALLEEIGRQFDALTVEAPDSIDGLRGAALAHYFRLALFPGNTLPAPAKQSADRARALFEELLIKDRGDSLAAWGLAVTRGEVGRRLLPLNQAGVELVSALDQLTDLLEPGLPVSRQHAVGLAAAARNIATLSERSQKFPAADALARLDRALSALNRAGNTPPATALFLLTGSLGHHDSANRAVAVASLYLARGELLAGRLRKPDDAAAAFEAVIPFQIFTRYQRLQFVPPDPYLVEVTALTYLHLAQVRRTQKRYSQAWSAISQAFSQVSLIAPAGEQTDPRGLREQFTLVLGEVGVDYLKSIDNILAAEGQRIRREVLDLANPALDRLIKEYGLRVGGKESPEYRRAMESYVNLLRFSREAGKRPIK